MELKRAAEGLTLVAVGLILLGNTLGIIPWGVWWNIFSLWPLLLVAAGIDVIGRGTDNSWLRILSSLIVIGGLAYGALVMPATGGNWSPFVLTPLSSSATAEPFDSSAPHDASVTRGRAIVKGGVGELTVTDGPGLATSSGRSPFDPKFDVRVTGNEASVDIGMGEGNWVVPRDQGRLDVTLDRQVAWDLTIDAGVSQIDADLSNLPVKRLMVKSGVSKGTVTLGAVDTLATDGGVPVTLETGVSTVIVRIKRGESVRLRVHSGLNSVDRAPEFRAVSGGGDKKVYETEGFSNSAFWDITLNAGISSVRVEFY